MPNQILPLSLQVFVVERKIQTFGSALILSFAHSKSAFRKISRLRIVTAHCNHEASKHSHNNVQDMSNLLKSFDHEYQKRIQKPQTLTHNPQALTKKHHLTVACMTHIRLANCPLYVRLEDLVPCDVVLRTRKQEACQPRGSLLVRSCPVDFTEFRSHSSVDTCSTSLCSQTI